jgi:hypothetical protein
MRFFGSVWEKGEKIRTGRAGDKEREAHLVVLHDAVELDNADEGEDLEVALNFLVRRSEEELQKNARQHGNEGEREDGTHLVDVEWRRHARIQPNGVSSALAELLPARRRQQLKSQPKRRILILLLRALDTTSKDVVSSDHVNPTDDVAELI